MRCGNDTLFHKNVGQQCERRINEDGGCSVAGQPLTSWRMHLFASDDHTMSPQRRRSKLQPVKLQLATLIQILLQCDNVTLRAALTPA
jgi:hypothetical protein